MRKVLFADDSLVARSVVAKRMAEEGIEVIVEDCAADAKGVDPAAIACALLDLDLGDGEGTDVAIALQAAQEGLPVAFFTSSATPDVIARAKKIGPVFHKPDELDVAVDWARAHSGKNGA